MKTAIYKKFECRGDVLNKKDAYIIKCSFSEISNIFLKYHYKKDSMGGGISICFAMFYKNELMGGAVLGNPRHENKYKNAIDIRRMACKDISPFNSESWFLSQIIKWLEANCNYDFVLSYSDNTVGHTGIIYKAANFKNAGVTSPTKFIEWNGKVYHPRSLSIERDYSYKMREDLKKGLVKLETGLPKNIWIYKLKNKAKPFKLTML